MAQTTTFEPNIFTNPSPDPPREPESGDIPARRPSALIRFANYIVKQATFLRLHVLAFTFIPLIFAAIFYASNGQTHVGFLDSMFVCYSAMTVTGLSTVNLSTTTIWQQAILYFLMIIGNFTFVSWIMVLVRKQFFRTHCKYILGQNKKPRLYRSRSAFRDSISSPIAAFTKEKIQIIGPTPVATSEMPKQSFEMKDLPDERDVPTYSSSPPAPSVHLPPENTQKLPTVEFASISSKVHQSATVPRKNTTTDEVNKIPDVPGSSQVRAERNPEPTTDSGAFLGLANLLKDAAPETYRKMERTMTLPVETRLEASSIPWLNFSGLSVGRNSYFHTNTLTADQVEEIGGTEYRALRLLSYLVPAYFVVTQLAAVLLFMPWLSSVSTYDHVFEAQPRLVSKPWFSIFNVMAAYTGAGLSLVDLGMVPFQEAYLMSIALGFSILAGNNALPVFLRFTIWILSKMFSEDSGTRKTLSFLLDHPRRCFLYLFPSHQTWFLVICLVVFSLIEWIGCLVLSIIILLICFSI